MPLQLVLETKGKLSLQEYNDPPLGPNSILLKSIYSGVSHGTEKMLYEGVTPKFEYDWNSELRHYSKRESQNKGVIAIGYETVAKVVTVGKTVKGWRLGEIVWLDAPHRETHILDLNNPIPFVRFYFAADPKRFALFALSRVALGGIHDLSPSIGDSIGVCGLGIVGLMCVLLLKKAGVRNVVALDRLANRLSLAEQFGAVVFNSGDLEHASAIKRELGALDSMIEVSGNYSGLDTAIKCVAPMGKVIVISSYGNQSQGIHLGHEFHRNRISLISSMTINDSTHPKYPLWNLSRLNAEAAMLLSEGVFHSDKLISHTIPFPQAVDTYESLLSSSTPPLKIVFSYE